MIDLKKDVQAFLSSKEDPVKLRGILNGLGLPQSDRQYVKSVLAELVQDGDVVRVGARYWAPDGKRTAKQIKQRKTMGKMELVGRLSITSQGYGFVLNPKGSDWMVPEKDLGQALDGDTVKARIANRDKKGRIRAEVVSIEAFGISKVLGVFINEKGRLEFYPFGNIQLDARMLKGFPKQAEDQSVAIWNRHVDGYWIYDGILGNMEDPKVDEAVVLAENGIADSFPEAVLKDAAQYEDFTFNLGDRVDFREEFVFTVDGATARDFDDALHIKPLGGNAFEVGVHIADVAEFVKPGSELDRWARKTGNSTYLPHKAIPMLPEILSTELCSLKPDVPRYTTSVVARVTRTGKVQNFKVVKGLIHSGKRFTYDDVVTIAIEKNPQARHKVGDYAKVLDNALNLSQAMRKRRIENGGLSLDRGEVVMSIDEDHRLESVDMVHQTDANRMIEAYMCMANECVAEYMHDLGIDIPYRIHDYPAEEKLENLASFLTLSGIDVPDGLFSDPARTINKIVREHGDSPRGEVLQLRVLKSLKMAVYSPENHGHFGLGSEFYAHFTSPIRRCADLVLHQRLTRLLNNPELGPEDFDDEGLAALCEYISTRERASMKAENTFQSLKQLRYMSNRLGEIFDGVITEVVRFGVFVQIAQWYASGLVHVETLDDDYYEYDEEQSILQGSRSGRKLVEGLSVKVRVVRVDLLARKLDLSIVSAESSPGNTGKQNKGRRGRQSHSSKQKQRRTLKGNKRNKR